jgi:triacylglycerol lipase
MGGESMAADATLSSADPLTLATLYLCNISYAADITTIPGLVQKTPALATGGVWSCLWGPVQSSDQSNLAFVAGYSPQPGAAVQSICVTIRGTNIYLGEDIWGILQQVWQDLDATVQVPLPWAPPGNPARIAQGTSDGLATIQGLTDGTGQSLGDYLKNFLGAAANANVASAVTGHSLGGCLTTVVAPWIESIRPASYKGIVQPITFAAPTAGNTDFATYYTTMFKTARRFQNTLDVIPMAFQDLTDVVDIYSSYGLDAPDIVWTGIFGMQGLLDYYSVTYQQPAGGAQMLTGSFLISDQNDWYAQALHQHHLATYLSLLTHMSVEEAALPQSATALGTEARLAKRLGSITDVLKSSAAPRAAG